MGTYKKLVEFYKNKEVSFKYVKTFNMDEYVGRWNKQFVRKNLLKFKLTIE